MLNPEDGTFEEITQELADLYKERPETKKWKKFRVGERVEVKGENFLVRKITKKDLILRPMKSYTTDGGSPPA